MKIEIKIDENEDVTVKDAILAVCLFLMTFTLIGYIGYFGYACVNTYITQRTYGKIENPILPNGMDSCEVYNTKYGRVVKCPNSTTNTCYRVGRFGHISNIAIDGDEK